MASGQKKRGTAEVEPAIDSGSALTPSANHELMSRIVLESRQVAQMNQTLFEKLNEAQKTIELLKRDVALLQNQHDEDLIHPQIRLLEEQLSEKSLIINQLKSEIEELNSIIKQKDEDISRMQAENHALESKLKSKNQIIEQLGSNLEEKEKAYLDFEEDKKKLSSSLDELQRQIHEKDKRVMLLEKLVRDKEEQIQNLHRALNDKESEKLHLLNVLKKIEADNNRLMRRAHDLSKNVNVLTEDLQIKDRIVQEAQRKNVETGKKLSALKKQLVELSERIDIMEKANKDAIERLEKAESKAKTLEQELSHQKTINRNLVAYYENLMRMEREKHETRMRALIADHTKRELELKTKIALLEEKEAPAQKQPSAILPPVPGFSETVLKPEKIRKEEKTKQQEQSSAAAGNKEELEDDSLSFSVATPEELVPMIKTAFDHGDSPETIRKSLLNAGYSPAVIEKAIEKVTQ
ncbi:hypothetical protein D6764_02860 [Candidatus Woesearchaeota archaeon]|nr:MAG: hypothetical protein D6764_02860 [Candidatus Woesearchaeota archaeon]